jgi:hypothetical protein
MDQELEKAPIKREGDFLKEKRGLMGFLKQKKSYLSLSSTLRLKTRLK